eukprot:scaffold24801_cov107-Phaeocystis_antarctica.AAC.6
MSNGKRSTRLAHERAATHYGVPFLAYADLMSSGKCAGERLGRHVAACRPHALPRHQSTYATTPRSPCMCNTQVDGQEQRAPRLPDAPAPRQHARGVVERHRRRASRQDGVRPRP